MFLPQAVLQTASPLPLALPSSKCPAKRRPRAARMDRSEFNSGSERGIGGERVRGTEAKPSSPEPQWGSAVKLQQETPDR